jgi:NTE family protein
MLRFVVLGLVVIMASGCASYGVIQNARQESPPEKASYSLLDIYGKRPENDLSLFLTFSGGGTRAAAMAYGVLQELRDTQVQIGGKPTRLLDEISVISSVSGGSFTAAYYGLYGDRIFRDYEQRFLRRDVGGALLQRLFYPSRWFSSKGRTEMAMEYLQQTVFGKATFFDIRLRGGPMILINASDLSSGARISFVQEYFNLLCSEVDSFPVAKAVAASAAVPVVFDPVVLENHPGCNTKQALTMLERARESATSPQMLQAVINLEKLVIDKERYRYLHLVDGGITDNLGLRTFYEIIELYGGMDDFVKRMKRRPARTSAIIVVDASTDPGYGIATSKKVPTIEQTIGAVTDIQVHRYNATTLELIQHSLKRWREQLSEIDRPLEARIVEVNLREIGSPRLQHAVNSIPTSFSLTDEQVDVVIRAGRRLLRNNPTFQALVNELNRTAATQ